MHEQQQQFAPWGTVTPKFWQAGQPDHPRTEAAPAPPNRQTTSAVADEPTVAPAPPPRPDQRIDTARLPRARSAGRPAAAEDTAPKTEPQDQDKPSPGPAEHQRPHDGELSAVLPEVDTERQGGTVGDEQSGPPPEYRDRINAITAAFGAAHDPARLAAAAVDAERLDQEITARYGQLHDHTVRLREIRGWLALLTGQPAVAARWYLHTSGLQIALYGADHAETEGSVRRAIHTWRQIKGPAEVVQIGGDLAKVVTAVLGEDSDAARFIRARLARYQQLPQ